MKTLICFYKLSYKFSFFTLLITSIETIPTKIPVGIEEANITKIYGTTATDDKMNDTTMICPIL